MSLITSRYPGHNSGDQERLAERQMLYRKLGFFEICVGG